MTNILEKLFDRNRVDEGIESGGELAILHVGDADFEQEVLTSDKPVIVDFWAPWCMPCRMIAPALEKLATEFGGEVKIAKVNTDENPQWAMHYGVQGIPTLLFIKEGQEIDRMVGVAPASQIKERLERLL